MVYYTNCDYIYHTYIECMYIQNNYCSVNQKLHVITQCEHVCTHITLKIILYGFALGYST